MGPFLALLTVLALHLVPADATTITVSTYVGAAIGVSGQPAVFRLDRIDAMRWSVHPGTDAPSFEVIVEGSVIRLIGDGADEALDLADALGLSEAWWEEASIAPQGVDPLEVERVPGGIDVRWSGPLAGQIRW
jgi:hypothetical protein